MKKNKKIKLIYIGKRIFDRDTGKLSSTFLTPDNREVYFVHVKYCFIGHYYEATETKESMTIEKTPPDLGEANSTENELDLWERENTIAETFATRVRKSKKGKNQAKLFFEEHKYSLLRAVENMSYFEVQGFVEGIIEEATNIKIRRKR